MGNRYESLAGASVLITGAARGLGRALAQAFGEQGARLALVDVDGPGLEATVAQLQMDQHRVVSLPVDLFEVAVAERVVDEVMARFGQLDVLVNNAAVVDGVPIEAVTPELFDQVIGVNLRAPLFLSRAAMRRMAARGGGRIVNVASMAGRTGGAYPTVICYAASKGGLLALTRSLAKVGAPNNVLVNAVLPSNIDSAMLWGPLERANVEAVLAAVPLGRTAQPAEVAELVLWLASSASSYVTGASWEVNGGWFMS